jgi:uncharacterized membrane protein
MSTAMAETQPTLLAGPPPAHVNRTVIAVVALVGVLLSTYMLLVKLGFIGELACGTGSCDRVQSSPWAVFLGVPVPLWGVIGYTAIFGIALLGVQRTLLRDEHVAAAMLALTAGAFAFSLYLTYLEAFVINAWCRWCVVSAALATLLFLCALPEIRRLRKQVDHA